MMMDSLPKETLSTIGQMAKRDLSTQGVMCMMEREERTFQRQGKMVGSSGAVYEGGWHMGRRSGFGRIDYPCGLYYEGEWKDGKPHGVGKMGSESSKYHFHGDFEKGSIKGTGTLMTPKGERSIASGLR